MKNTISNKRTVVPYEYQFVCFQGNIIKLASKLNHNCDNLTAATRRPAKLFLLLIYKASFKRLSDEFNPSLDHSEPKFPR